MTEIGRGPVHPAKPGAQRAERLRVLGWIGFFVAILLAGRFLYDEHVRAFSFVIAVDGEEPGFGSQDAVRPETLLAHWGLRVRARADGTSLCELPAGQASVLVTVRGRRRFEQIQSQSVDFVLRFSAAPADTMLDVSLQPAFRSDSLTATLTQSHVDRLLARKLQVALLIASDQTEDRLPGLELQPRHGIVFSEDTTEPGLYLAETSVENWYYHFFVMGEVSAEVPIVTSGSLGNATVPWPMFATPHEFIDAMKKKAEHHKGTVIWGIEINMVPPLVARPYPENVEGTAPHEVAFRARPSGGSTPYEYRWDFGDGSTSEDRAPTHVFRKPGNYDASLAVKDAAGQSVSFKIPVRLPTRVNCYASVDREFGPAPLLVGFQGSGAGGKSPYVYEWDFGDGETSSAQNAVHSYAEEGSFEATLTVRDAGTPQQVSQCTVSVSVTTLVAEFDVEAVDTQPGVMSRLYEFQVKAIGGIPPVSFEWDFGDGSLGEGNRTRHEYVLGGLYEAHVQITDSSTPPQVVIRRQTVDVPGHEPGSEGKLSVYTRPEMVRVVRLGAGDGQNMTIQDETTLNKDLRAGKYTVRVDIPPDNVSKIRERQGDGEWRDLEFKPAVPEMDRVEFVAQVESNLITKVAIHLQ